MLCFLQAGQFHGSHVPLNAAQAHVEACERCVCIVLVLLLHLLVPLWSFSMLRQHPLPGTQHCRLQEASERQELRQTQREEIHCDVTAS
jgi:hypothetical protein